MPTTRSGAYTVNLRGLGSGSTLTLIDGHRLANAEGSGAVDLNLIPLRAIERIEVLPEGASAIYGSDAVAGVVNFVLSKDYDGVALSAASGAATDGTGSLQRYGLLAGHHWEEDGRVLAYGEWSAQSAVDSGQRSYAYSPPVQGTSLLPETHHTSVFLAAEQSVTEQLKASMEGLWTRRFNALTENLSAKLPGVSSAHSTTVNQYAVIADAELKVSNTWKVILTGDVAADSVVDSVSLSDGSCARQDCGEASTNRLRSLSATADGRLFPMPAGPAKLALGADYREERFAFRGLPGGSFPISHTRRVRVAFAETTLPIFRAADRKDDGPHSLLLSLAGRYENYDDFGSHPDPKISLLYTPIQDLHLRASWGRSFRAPTLLQQYDPEQAILQTVADPAAPSGQARILQRFGGNAGLHAEESTAYVLGISFKSSARPGLSLTLNVYDVEYNQRIGVPTANTQDPLSDPFITHDPSTALLSDILNGAQFINRTTDSYDPAHPANVDALVDNRYHNIGRERASGIDLASHYRRNTTLGGLDLSLEASYLELRGSLASASPMGMLSGTVFYPPRYRARAGIAWDRDGYGGAAFLNYTGRSGDGDSTQPLTASAWTTVDTQWTYTTESLGSWGAIQLSVAVRNLFDRRPPAIEGAPPNPMRLTFDPTNTSPLGRFLSFELSGSW